MEKQEGYKYIAITKGRSVSTKRCGIRVHKPNIYLYNTHIHPTKYLYIPPYWPGINGDGEKTGRLGEYIARQYIANERER